VSAAVVLVVDDDPQIRRAVERALTARDLVVRAVSDGRAAVGAVAVDEPDLVVLDLNLPHMDGLTACREIRRSSRVPILVLSVRDAEQDKVAALDLGADAYLSKPFGAAELLARVNALLRRARTPTTARHFRLEGLEIDIDGRIVRRAADALHLTPTEWRLIETLAATPGVLRTHASLLEAVWGADAPDVEALRVFVSQVRRKIEPDPRQPRVIGTDPGVGYRWLLEPSP
jgi:two-component system KDP operon response regulator KdpE